MDLLQNYFNDFTLKARVMPGLVIVLPLIPYSLVKGLIDLTFTQDSVLYGLIFIILTTILASVSRNQGKKKEKKIYKELGGMPTTIMMRFSDETLSYKSKVRYHEILNEKIPNLNLPLNEEEEYNMIDVDEKYKSAIDWLRLNANSDTKKFSLVYEELKNYNFSRNLYGLKNIGLMIYFFIGLREFLIIKNFSIVELVLMPYPQYVSLLLMIGGAAIILVSSNKNTVKNRAYDYAKALIETCDKLDLYEIKNN